jgi:hypothetical protein
VLEELRFGSAWIAEQQAVDVATHALLVVDLLHAAKERQEQRALHMLVAVNRRCEGPEENG